MSDELRTYTFKAKDLDGKETTTEVDAPTLASAWNHFSMRFMPDMIRPREAPVSVVVTVVSAPHE